MTNPLTHRGGRFVRLAETARPALTLTIDGHPASALEGDTLLVALLTHGRRVRSSEFGDGTRAGFCLMGACQDCWVWDEAGRRLRACSTTVASGMAVRTTPPPSYWPLTADVRMRKSSGGRS
ncbi:MAG: (2Fe-2S)-binding protein [Burkholderiales bacterium]